jgi:hypothetical protein
LRALLDGQETIGCTLHYINDDSIDTGAIVDCAFITADKNHSLFWHVLELYNHGMKLISSAIVSIEQNRDLKAITQESSTGRYYSYPTEEEFEIFLKKGLTIVKEAEYNELLGFYLVSSHPLIQEALDCIQAYHLLTKQPQSILLILLTQQNKPTISQSNTQTPQELQKKNSQP